MSDVIDVILVAHSVHAEIPEDEMRAAIPQTWIVRGVVSFQPIRVSLDETRGVDWARAARLQTEQWRGEVVTLLRKYPSAEIAYFGLAPIPLAVQLGSLVETFSGVRIFLRHHSTRSWKYSHGKKPRVDGPDGVTEATRSTEPALIAVSTTAPCNIEAARELIGPTCAELEIRTDPLGADVLSDHDSVSEVTERFRQALERIESNRQGVSEIHLIAAIPVGLAFALGCQLSPTRHARVVTYQYHRSAEPHLVEALRLPLRAVLSKALTPEERVAASNLRDRWELERRRLAEFGRACSNAGHWSSILGERGEVFQNGAFGHLQKLGESAINTPIDLSIKDVEGGFQYDRVRARWLLADDLLSSIQDAVAPDQLDRAGRMLLLHEALHESGQGLNSATARQIRLAPKVLEELDYLADTWTMLHEFAFSELVNSDWEAQRPILLQIVETAIATMWAFDVSLEPGILEVRRINRYLIWYGLLVRLEQADDLAQALRIFSEKPVIDLVAQEPTLRDGRLIVFLRGASSRPAEICYLDSRGRLKRSGDTNASSASEIARALGAHDQVALRDGMRRLLGGVD